VFDHTLEADNKERLVVNADVNITLEEVETHLF
jgi:hypothetical protein